jgi:REP element-mobilizing transposase RayT
MYLKCPEIARLVVEVLQRGVADGLYELNAFVVMANHVHVLVLPHSDVSRMLQWIKGVTAREANHSLGRTGKAFWQRESYDHWVRCADERVRIASYIENNPVKAGLVDEASQYPWSSASLGFHGLKPTAAR